MLLLYGLVYFIIYGDDGGVIGADSDFTYDKTTNQMEGIDIDIVRGFAKNIGVEAVFDKESKTYNGLLKRTGEEAFDLTIGKLSTFYKRMEDAHPHEYMKFRHALLANRKTISK